MEKILGLLIGIALAGAIVLAINVIPWLIWNHVIAPLFDWRHFTFWQCFFLCWFISFVANLFRSSK